MATGDAGFFRLDQAFSCAAFSTCGTERCKPAHRRPGNGTQDVVFVDVASAMLGDDGARHDLFVPDGLHMNATGYAIWTDAIRHALVTRGTAAVERLEQMRRFAREHVVVLPRSAPQQSITNEP
jgi:hypothetical protein